jgi:UDP-N-acetylmuramoylalanine--D-glutamate ligase
MDLSGKKIGVYGLGVSGQATLRFLANKKLAEVVVVSEGDSQYWDCPEIVDYPVIKISQSESEKSEEALALCDFIILSPGIARTVPILRAALKKGVAVWNEVELAYRFFTGNIIAVTGTNGKTTTVSFLGELFKNAGQRVFVGGNIGVPFLEAIMSDDEFDLAVLELSSFQCESLDQFGASHNIILNIAENHGERYESVDDYCQAKWLMVKNTCAKDHVYIGLGVNSPRMSIECKVHELKEDWDEEFKEKFSWRDMKIIGAHNRYNMYFAYQVSRSFGVSDEIFEKTLLSFSGVAHRIERLGQNIFNDAKSTNWLATKTAVEAVCEVRKNEKITLIIGGKKRSGKDLPEQEMISFLVRHCHQIYAIGDVAGDLEKLDKHFIAKEKLDDVINELDLSDLILFSPAYPSFDQYQNYIQRGEHFKKLIGEHNDH